MPGTTLSKKIFEKAIGKKVTPELIKRIELFGVGVDKIDGDEMHIEVSPNRMDYLSERGLSRAFSSFIGVKTGLKQYKTTKSGKKVIIDKSVEAVRPFTACAIVSNLKFDDEKIREVIQIQEKLHVTYGRNRKRVAIGIYPSEKITYPITFQAKKPEDIRFRPLEAEKILSEEPVNPLETKKLFWENPYLTNCTAKVTQISERKVKLDRTIFYAFSGGQESDSGTINGIKVINAIKQGDKESIINIEYELEKEPNFKIGDTIELKIDAEKRNKLMRLHSAAHIAYYFITEQLGKLKIIGSNITSDKARVDFEYDKPLTELLQEIEKKTNKFLEEKHAINTFGDEKNKDLRWWHCEKWKMPCGGTHVKNTEDIGEVQLKRKNIGAGKERIEIYLSNKIMASSKSVAKETENSQINPNKTMTAKQILEHHTTGKEFAHLLKDAKVYPIFTDAKGQILSMPPIINSHDIGRVTEKTKEVFIECSGFDYSVLSKCLNMIVTALADMGGQIQTMELVYGKKKIISPDLKPEEMKVDFSYINKRLGLNLKESEFKKLFEKMGYAYKSKKVLIPAYRTDVLHNADLAEDIAIAYGYENIKPQIPKVATTASESKEYLFVKKIADIFIGLGFLETSTYHLIDKESETKLMNIKTDLIALENSVSEEYMYLRKSMLPSLIKVLSNNKHHEMPQKIFESGITFEKDVKYETGIKETRRLACAVINTQTNYTDAKQVLDAILSAINVEYTIKASEHASCIQGRVGSIIVKGKTIGFLGEVSPQVLSNFKLNNPVAAFEIDIDELLSLMK